MNLFKILIHLPLSIQKLPYFIGLQLVRLAYFDLPIKIWPRNSYILGSLICTLSDLDLTFFATKKVEIYSKLWRYRLLKIFLPFLGEINFYHKEKVSRFLNYANLFEIGRDPKLMEILAYRSTEGSSYEKIVFFLKVLESDRRNLKKIPTYRERKWKLHIKNLGWEMPNDLSLDALISLLSKQLQEVNLSGKVFLKTFFPLATLKKEDLNNIYEECSRQGLIKDYILFYPFYWIGSSFYHDSFEHDLELIKNLNESESRLLAEQIRWELWGLFTQLEVTPDKATLLMHLENIKRLVKNIHIQELLDESLESIELLTELVESTLENYKV